MIVLNQGSATHVGLTRRHNEDGLFVGRRVWAVADGMGGHAAGEVASRLALEAMAELDAADLPLTRESVIAAIDAANARILTHGRSHPRTLGMGTTLTGAAVVTDDGADVLCVFNVGDSRVYRFSRHGLVRLTVDHSEVEELVARGLITPAQARTHPLRNIVTRCLGSVQEHEPDTSLVTPTPGERLLICSDGLSGEASDSAIAYVLGTLADPQEAADALVRAALDGGGHDNITLIVLDVADEAD